MPREWTPKVIAMFALFAVMLLGIPGSMHYYFWARLVRDIAVPSPWRQALGAAFLVLAVSVPASFFLMRFLSPGVARTVLWPVYVWMGLSFLLLIGFGTADGVRAVVSLLSRFWGADGGEAASPERRVFLARAVNGSVGVLAAGTGALGVWAARSPAEVREVQIVLPRLPRALDGLSIVQLTDMHVGPTLGLPWVGEIVDRAMRLKPDVVAITGDLVDGSVAQLRDDVAPLATLWAPHGVYFVTGNHEYYSGAEQWTAELRRIGVRVLQNERVSIGEGAAAFDLAGIPDLNGADFDASHKPDLAAALAGRDPARALVLLAHQPKQAVEASAHDVGLVLSGHTHGGQIWPFNYLVRLQQPIVAGLGRIGATQVYVSCGTGYWGPPMRVGIPAEITRLILRAPV